MSTAVELPRRRVWTVEDLAELPRDLRYELVEGELILPSPTVAHQDLSMELMLAVRANCPPTYIVSVDQSLAIDQLNEPRPDIVAVRIEHYRRTPVPLGSAVLAIEVISEHSEFRDMVTKAKVYARAGIAAYWVVDQKHDRISLVEMVLDPGHEQYTTRGHTTGVFSVDVPWPITIDLPALSARRAALLERAKQEE
ncbi:MAG: Uma2 family endonuclease [Micromonosporaceae bacterium]|nr:Uma2 family endonuclease [Micromonosporaceae bacterium]